MVNGKLKGEAKVSLSLSFDQPRADKQGYKEADT